MIFDVSANVDTWSNFVASKCPKTTIYSFKPIKDNFKLLEFNTVSIKKIYCNNFALSNQEEKIEFIYYLKDSYFSSIYDNLLGGKVQKIIISCITGDQYCE